MSFGSLLFEDHNGDAGRVVGANPINCSSNPDSIMDTSDSWYDVHP